MAKCYRKSIDHSHRHIGPPFSRCRDCDRIICHECIGRNLTSGHVLCVECTVSAQNRQGASSTFTSRVVLPPKPINPLPMLLLKEMTIVVVNSTTWLFSSTANILLKILEGASAPFRTRDPEIRHRKFSVDVSFATFQDKTRFTGIFIAVLIFVAVSAIFYADLNQISRSRMLLAIAATGVFWGIVSVYLQYFFTPVLQQPMSNYLAYAIAFFVALVFGSWLIEQHWLDTLLFLQ